MSRLLVLWQFLLLVLDVVSGKHYEKALYEHLLKDYEMLERPVKNHSEPVKVYMALLLQQIVDVDEKNQIIETNIWQQLEWHDYRLQWNPAEFGNVTDLRFPIGKLWKPDVLLYNSVDHDFDTTYPSNMVIDHSGNVSWVPPGIVRISCSIDITWFPFDDQMCYFKFGSWTYNTDKMDLLIHKRAFDTSEYMKNGEWILLETPVERNEKFYECCPDEKYASLFFYFKIRRRTLYYGFNMIVPSVIISLMTVLGFALPVESGEKITMEITILLSVCVFFTMIANLTPSTSEAVPLIGTFFTCHMFVVSISVIFSVLVLNFYYRSAETEMSPTMRNLLLNWLPWLLMMERPRHNLHRRRSVFSSCVCAVDFSGLTSVLEEDTMAEIFDNDYAHSPSERQYLKRRSDAQLCEDRLKHCLRSIAGNRLPNADPGLLALVVVCKRILHELESMARRAETVEEQETSRNDWKFASTAVDRLCLIFFTVFIVVSSCGVLFSAPHLIA